MNDMTYLKPTKNKIRLFLFLIISAFIAGIFISLKIKYIKEVGRVKQ
jgi:hypothetical protein